MKKTIHAVYLMHSLKGLAGSFISMFIPIYLLTLHYSLTQVFVYYLIYFTAILFLFLVASLIARNIGLKRTIILYFPFQLAYLIFLYVLPFIHIPLWIIAITSALQLVSTGIHYISFSFHKPKRRNG